MEKPGYPFGAARKAGASYVALGLMLLAGALLVARVAHAAPPNVTVSFRYEPTTPLVNEPVTFTSTSTVSPNNTIVNQLWDLNGDGVYGDATGATATRAFAAAGRHTVGLRVIDKRGEDQMHVATQTITVVSSIPQNRAPVASFVYYPSAPVPGATVNFYSTSTDPDSPIARQAWDLDGDGTFGDVVGPTAARSFPAAGTFTVGLEVVDTKGAASEASQTVVVESPLGAPGTSATGFRLLSPFPVVRLSGTIGGQGIRVRRLTVSGPSGLKVLLRCRGHHCPFKRYSIRDRVAGRSVVARSSPSVHIARVLRLRRLEGRRLRAGIQLQLYITKPEMIGKYTRFRVRRGKPPARVDRCLVPGLHYPRRCPSS